jgi:transcriptional regulator with XRE-family HTH domain
MMQSKIKSLAQEAGYEKPEHLSKETNLTRSTLYNVWTGDISNRKISTLFLIAGVLNVPIDHLFEMVES